MQVVLASGNKGKIREFAALLQPIQIEIIPQSEWNISDIEETGLTFIENALLKARHAAEITGLPVIADDSGLAVTALQGAPGIYSARYAGAHAKAEDNIQKLLSNLKNISDRSASFHCVLVYMQHALDPTPIVCDGKWDGTILDHPQGEFGFGYDPIFYVPEQKKSAAELPLELKNQISHRGIAIQSLLKALARNNK